MKADKHAQTVEFIHDNCPRWILNPELVQKLGLRHIFVQPSDYVRGQADNLGHLWLSTTIAKFRHSSPYTSPRGKSDMSPIGVFSHEMGHILWFALVRSFTTRQRVMFYAGWISIFVNRSERGITSYAKTHPEEDFAEAHRLFVLNSKLLKQLSPRRYEFMQACYLWLFGTKNPKAKFKQSKRAFVQQWERLVS